MKELLCLEYQKEINREQFPKVVEIKMERFFLERTHSIFLI